MYISTWTNSFKADEMIYILIPLTKIKSQHLLYVHFFFQLAVNKQIRDKTQDILP